MVARSPRWLDVVRHKARGMRAPFLLILQHHEVTSATVLAAPVIAASGGAPYVLAPRLNIDDAAWEAYLLGLSPIPRSLLLETVASAEAQSDCILNALDIILHGYPVGLPR